MSNHIKALKLRRYGMRDTEAVCNLLRLKNKYKQGLLFSKFRTLLEEVIRQNRYIATMGGADAVRAVSLTYTVCLEKLARKSWALRPAPSTIIHRWFVFMFIFNERYRLENVCFWCTVGSEIPLSGVWRMIPCGVGEYYSVGRKGLKDSLF